MKYRSVNEAEHFNYHDAILMCTYQDNSDLIMEFDGICVEPSSSQNSGSKAMRTEFLRMRFLDGRLTGGKIYGCTARNPDGTEEEVCKERDFTDRDLQEVMEHLCSESNFWVYYGCYTEGQKARTSFSFDIDLKTFQGIFDAVSNLEIFCTGIVMEWDSYCGLAWYEPRQKHVLEKGGQKNG